jgi:hypothetical protein
VDAAATRVVGNEKVPATTYGNQPANEALVAENKALRKEIKALLVRLTEIKVSEAPFDQLDAENAKLDALLAEFQIVLDKTSAIEARALNATPYSSEFSEKLRGQLIDIITAMQLANDLKKAIRQEKRQAQARQQA